MVCLTFCYWTLQGRLVSGLKYRIQSLSLVNLCSTYFTTRIHCSVDRIFQMFSFDIVDLKQSIIVSGGLLFIFTVKFVDVYVYTGFFPTCVLLYSFMVVLRLCLSFGVLRSLFG